MTKTRILLHFLFLTLSQSVTLTHGFSIAGLVSSWTAATATTRDSNTITPPSNVRLLILPGFGNDSNDYYLPEQLNGSLIHSLKKRGWTDEQLCVLPVQRVDWLQVFYKGILDVKFWRGTMPPTRPSFAWYLERIAQQIEDLCYNDNVKVVLLCHSAGGWLARAALGFGNPCSNNESAELQRQQSTTFTINLENVLGMVTLGSPHLAPPEHVMDMTRGALATTDANFPGAYHSDLFYLSVIGAAVQGVQRERRLLLSTKSTVSNFAYDSYFAVCGNGATMGDGVVPVCAAHLNGAAKRLTLPSVYHSINAPNQWYGSDAIIDFWHADMLQEIGKKMRTKNSVAQPENALQQLFNR
ncbi:hypothetical protein MPSEU_001039200 [Mayamaea pseudoterrestris]|nr:hypothetical protein MPSEU_001039200 [Mayamaea pseudoterrestris]